MVSSFYVYVKFVFHNPGVSNSNYSLVQIRAYKTTRGLHFDADATISLTELTKNSFYTYFLRKVSWISL